MRYAIFSDVHANQQAWEAVREDIVKQGVDTLVCLGDVVGYGPKPLEVLSAVRAGTANFVLGNHDYYFGSVQHVRQEVSRLCQCNPQLTYLTDAQPCLLYTSPSPRDQRG